MRLDDLHCTGPRQDGRDLPKDMESMQSLQDAIKQDTTIAGTILAKSQDMRSQEKVTC